MNHPYDYALLSADAYRDIRRHKSNYAPTPPGWTELTDFAVTGSGRDALEDGSGFSARVYQNDETGEIVISYAGTQFGGSRAGQKGDWLSGNVPLAVGLAAMMGVIFDRPARVFAPPPFKAAVDFFS